MPNKLTRRLYVMAIVLLILSVANFGIFFRYLLVSRGDAAMINRLGMVRGQIQRVTKLSLAEQRDEEDIQEAVTEIDVRLAHFSRLLETRFNIVTGEMNAYLEELQQVWSELKPLLKEGAESELVPRSEEAWRVADASVIYLQRRAERQRLYLYLSLITLLLHVAAVGGSVHNIRRMIDRRIEYHAAYDELTGALNRTTLVERLNAMLAAARRHGRPFSVLMIDIDHFKRINDELGHHTGDKVLKGLSQRLGYNLRAEDLLFRYGGEEFLVVLQDAGLANAVKTAEKLRFQTEERPFLDEVAITISCGVAAWRKGDDDASVIERADAALYQAKEDGRNRVVSEKRA